MRAPRLFYFCYSHDQPTGGQKHTYQHVDILNKHGIDAYVMHPVENYRLTWFENDTRVIGPSEFAALRDVERDYTVLPEDLGRRIGWFKGKKVIFNKNLFNGYLSLGFERRPAYPSCAKDVVAVLTVSEHNRAHVQYAYPNQLVRVVHAAIRPEVFSWRPLNEKKPQIATIVKSEEWLSALYHTVQSRALAGLNRGNDFNWVFLGKQTERETAAILNDSLLFVFPSIIEGLPRLPLEAMSCGCLVAAWRYGPLKETLPASTQFEFGDLIDIVTFIEAVMRDFPDALSSWESLAQAGRDIASAYSVERQEQSVLAAWAEIFATYG